MAREFAALTNTILMRNKSSQVNTLPKAKSQAKDKRAKDRQKYAALRCKVGVAGESRRETGMAAAARAARGAIGGL